MNNPVFNFMQRTQDWAPALNQEAAPRSFKIFLLKKEENCFMDIVIINLLFWGLFIGDLLGLRIHSKIRM